MTWSKLQEDIFDFVKTKRDNLVVVARAGTGKSTTIEEMVGRVGPRRTLVCTFSNKIRDELSLRLMKYPHATVKGLNQLGYGTLQRHRGGKVEIDKYRISDYAKRLIPNNLASCRSDVTKLATLSMLTLSVDSVEAIEDLMYEFDLAPQEKTLVAQYVSWVKDIVAFCLANPGTCTFTEQVFIPAYLNLTTGNFDIVMVDEAQDLSPAQLRLVLNSVKSSGRVIAVGDDRQAIYRFNGASLRSIDDIVEATNAKTLPLSITYRCPKAVVRLVNPLVPDYEAGPSAPEGSVTSVSDKEFLKEVREGDAVISRTNSALTKYAMELLAQGRRVRILGRDLESQLGALIERSKATTVDAMLSSLNSYVTKEAYRLEEQKKDDKAEELRDNFAALGALCEDCETMADVHAKIRKIFANATENEADATKPDIIPFMSAHKSKGLEFDRVWMFETTFNCKSTEGQNLYYVAATRAKRELFLVQVTKKDGTKPKSWAKEQGFFKDDV